MLQGQNGKEIYEEILKRAEAISLLPATPNNAGDNTVDQSPKPDIDPIKLASEMKLAARKLGDGESLEFASHKPKQETLEQMGEPNTNPESEAAKGPELSGAVKEAVLNQFDFTNKEAEMTAGARKAMSIGVPLASMGAGYAGGRIHGEHIDRKNNQAYYEAGIYDAARRIASQITSRQRSNKDE